MKHNYLVFFINRKCLLFQAHTHYKNKKRSNKIGKKKKNTFIFQ